MKQYIAISLLAMVAATVGCQKPPEVKAVKVSQQKIEATVSGVSSGTVRSEQIAELAFGTVGRVKVLNVKLGDQVKEGQVLAEVENDDLRSRVSFTREELERRRRLNSDNAISRSSLILAQSEFDAANTALEKSIIRAPCGGLVAELNLEVGQLSQITAVIPKAPIRVVDVKPRYVRVEIDEVDLPRIQVGMSARVKILAVRKEPFIGRVRKVVNFVSDQREQDRTAELEVDIVNDSGTLPVGASADVEIITDTRDSALALPTRVVLGRLGARYVYRLDGEIAKKTIVATGLYNYLLTEITEGVKNGDDIVIPSDAVEVVDGMRVKKVE